MALFAHFFFHEEHFSTHENKKFSHTHSPPPSKKHMHDTTSLGKPPITPPWAYSPCPMQGSKSFPLINGLLILYEPTRIENNFSLLWDLGWEFLSPMKH
jgi:hypothetical protein